MYGCVLHLDIKSEKILMQHDDTEIGIADEVVKLGVPKSDIVLAFGKAVHRVCSGLRENQLVSILYFAAPTRRVIQNRSLILIPTCTPSSFCFGN